MNVRSIWQHSGLVLTSALSISLMFGCGDEAVQDGGSDLGPILVDAGPDGGDGGMCKGVNKMCFEDNECCPPFKCDQIGNLCKPTAADGGPDSGMTCAKSGEACLTYADCCAGLGLACNTDGGASETCGPNTAQPTAKCQTDTNPCGGDGGLACCAGNCISGSCVAWPVCGTSQPNGTCTSGAATCGSDIECCTGNTCDGGSCGEVCGGTQAKCAGSGALDTCCHDSGEWCWNVGSATVPNNICLPLNQENQNLSPTNPCGPKGSAYQCDLTAYCNPGISGTDECASAGLACISVAGFTFGGQPLASCQLPGEFATCIVGGPPCQPIGNSSATNLQCLPLNGGNICLQPCVTTADCVDTFNSCQAVGDGKACLTDTPNPSCTAAFTSCDSAGSNDGFCQQITFSNGMNADVCIQSATVGGGLGSCCNVNGNRQNGALCAYPNVCSGGICTQGCAANPPAGTAPDSGLLCDTSNGPQYCFFPGVASSGLTLGSCSPPCDALNLNDAGSCPVATAGNPEQNCTPTLFFDATDPTVYDTVIGVCTAAPTGVTIVPPEGDCTAANTSCQEGSACFPGLGLCKHLCGPVGSFPDGGNNGCQVGETCFGIGGVGPQGTDLTTKIGFCDKACDGGPC